MFKVWSANGYFWLIESITIWQKIFEKAQITAGSRPRRGPTRLVSTSWTWLRWDRAPWLEIRPDTGSNQTQEQGGKI